MDKTRVLNVEIKAGVQGKESVEALTARLDDMARVLEGDLKQQAQAAAQKLRELAEQQAAIAAFEKLKREAVEAAHALKLAEKEAADFATQISTAGPPTAQQAAGLHKLQQAADAARKASQQQAVALGAASAELSRHGIAASNTKAAQQRLAAEADQVRDAVQKLGAAYPTTESRAAAAAEGMTRSHRAIGEGVNSISAQLQNVQSAYLALQSGSALVGMVKDAAATADAYNTLAARIKLTTGEGKAFEDALGGVQRVAVDTRSDLAATAELFTKLSEAGKTLGVSQREALALTQTINQAIQLSGGGAEAAKAAITQLVQGLQSGVLRGDEFNSVMEQSPRLAKALAEGLGVGTGKLREMAEAGRLTSDTVIKSLQGQTDAVAKEFAKLPPTVGGALQNLSTAWTVYVGQVDKASGASKSAAQAIGYLADNLDTIAGYLVDAGQAAAAFVAVRLAQGFLSAGQAAKAQAAEVAVSTAAVQANTAAQVANNAAQSSAAGVSRLAADQLYRVGTVKTEVTTKAGVMSQALGVASGALGAMGAAARGAVGLLGGIPGVAALVLSNIKDIGTWMGEGAAKLVLWAQGAKNFEQQARELAESERVLKERLEATADARKKQALADEAAATARFGLSEAAKKLIGDFDDLIKKGESTDAAISKIGKDFDLGNMPGIKAAAGVLDKLAADGKISASQMQQAWAQALDGKDLAKFEVMAQAALSGAGRSAEQLAQTFDAGLREAIRRTGLDMDIISGGMSKASVSALNDVETIVAGFDKLKAKGIDAATALTASLGKAIDTADSQKAIDAVRSRIEALRKVLGDKITDGLLDQTREKAVQLREELDKANPGIQRLKKAMEELGITSQQTLDKAATDARRNFDVMLNSGKATARELQDGFVKVAEAAIKANGGVATEAIKAEAAMRGLEISADGVVRKMTTGFEESRQAAMSLTGAIEDQTTALERENAAIEKANAAREKAAELERKRLNVDKDGFTLDKNGQRLTMGGQVKIPEGYYFDSEAANKDPKFRSGQSDGSQYVKKTPEKEKADEAQYRQSLEDARNKGNGSKSGSSVFGPRTPTPTSAPLPSPTPAPDPLPAAAPAPSAIGGASELSQLIAQLHALTAALSTSGRTVTLNIGLNGTSYGSVSTNEAGEATLTALLQQLTDAAARA